MPIVLIGLSHRTAPVELRERFAFNEAAIPDTLGRLREAGLAQEGVILSTCNRVELYVVTPGTHDPGGLLKFLLESRSCQDAAPDVFYLKTEPQSLDHLFRVACGLDSMLLGETEILGQLKQAYDLALKYKFTGGRLNKTFQRAFNVAKQIRTETNIQRGSVSVASAAVELAEKIFATLKGHQVMVIGAGDTGEKTARALMSRGASDVVVTNRTHETAAAMAASLGGRAVAWDRWADEFGKIDIVISSTSAPHYILTPAQLTPLMQLRHHQPLLLIDIAVPRDIDPEVNRLDDVYLYNIDDLQAIASEYMKQRQEEIARCEAIIRDKVKETLDGFQRPGLPGAAAPAGAA